MTNVELQELLQQMDESQVGMARKLRISDRNMRRYISGQLPIPKVVEMAVRCLAEHPQNGRESL
jgi:hypothetical protein